MAPPDSSWPGSAAQAPHDTSALPAAVKHLRIEPLGFDERFREGAQHSKERITRRYSSIASRSHHDRHNGKAENGFMAARLN